MRTTAPTTNKRQSLRPHTAERSYYFSARATPAINPLSLHDALPIWPDQHRGRPLAVRSAPALGLERGRGRAVGGGRVSVRSEEHTSELQSHVNLVCRLLLEKKQHPSSPQHSAGLSLDT